MLKNPFVESVADDHTQLSPKDFPLSFTRAVSFLESLIFLLILCADFELGAEWLPLRGLRLPGSGLKSHLVSLGFHLMV